MISLILSGGIGSRLWPLSRKKLPKQFSPLLNESLFVNTVKRLQTFGDVQVCTSAELKGLTEMAIRKSHLRVSNAFYEPMGRNTAPAIALACWSLQEQNKQDEVLGVFPSDHWIDNMEQFAKALQLAENCARDGQIVTIGIKPDRPATGFGYIQRDEKVFKEAEGLQAFSVKGFKEKPDLKTAQEYLDSGQYNWNSGMFVFKVETMIESFKKFMPVMWEKLQELKSDLSNLEEVYSQLESQSIDYGIMEQAENQVNIPCDIGWNDLGSWDDISDIAEKKSIQSSVATISQNAKNCFAHGEKEKLVCFLGVQDLIVVDTDDAILVAQKGKTQEVKDLVTELKGKHEVLLTDHTYEHRPWGTYRNLYEEETFKTKVITVDPGQRLSYQSHKQRAEVWVTVEGEGVVVLNGEEIKVSPGKVVSIPAGAKHRMSNSGDKVLKFVEVQLGDYFGEDDITRYEDDYKRM